MVWFYGRSLFCLIFDRKMSLLLNALNHFGFYILGPKLFLLIVERMLSFSGMEAQPCNSSGLEG